MMDFKEISVFIIIFQKKAKKQFSFLIANWTMTCCDGNQAIILLNVNSYLILLLFAFNSIFFFK